MELNNNTTSQEENYSNNAKTATDGKFLGQFTHEGNHA